MGIIAILYYNISICHRQFSKITLLLIVLLIGTMYVMRVNVINLSIELFYNYNNTCINMSLLFVLRGGLHFKTYINQTVQIYVYYIIQINNSISYYNIKYV